jgi:hypothetical protein
MSSPYAARRVLRLLRKRMLSRSSMRRRSVCHPGPSALKAASVSGLSRNETCASGFSDFGRPRFGGDATSSGITSATGRARRNISAVHSGFSLSGRVRLRLFGFFIPFPFTRIRFSETDHAHGITAASVNKAVQPPTYRSKSLKAGFAVFVSPVLNHNCLAPGKGFSSSEIHAVLGEILAPFPLIPVQPHRFNVSRKDAVSNPSVERNPA